ncbi:unnamed protein product [Allacma fusca]|uniref:Methyltransferase domain-containing protein n=1 Tax=Allacma fusca TaxID=39272 RepID=A0A8J2LNR4_9HEXA|nr:unnamed protein product [Allacma fusca]
MYLDKKSVEIWLSYIREFMNLYRWLSEAFVLDHFVNKHWEQLPLAWRHFLSQLSPSQLGQWILHGRLSENVSTPAPLALECLRRSAEVLSVDRRFKPRVCSEKETAITEKQRKILNLHVKPKKRHEIWELSFLIQELADKSGGIRNVVDVGSGLGHLCRFLSFGLNFTTVGIDSNAELGNTAGIFNEKIHKNFQKLRSQTDASKPESENFEKIQHLNQFLEAGDKIVPNYEFGLVGLHGCGDLGGIIVQNFVQNPQVKFLSFVSCCYMKLTQGYPLSNYLKESRIDLPYVSLELSCHAKEAYMERLNDSDQVNKLKIHCYRAALETILVKKGFAKEGLRSVKNTHLLGFKEYAVKATEKLSLKLSNEELECKENEKMLQEWMKVVCFYTLRVLLAPVIESAVLLDRALFILENEFTCGLLPIFDPVKSPRNVVIIGMK